MMAHCLHKFYQRRRTPMNNYTFESALARLNEIITILERNEVPLAKAAELYQEGQNLVTYAQTLLTQFETLLETKGDTQ